MEVSVKGTDEVWRKGIKLGRGGIGTLKGSCVPIQLDKLAAEAESQETEPKVFLDL